MGRKAKSSRANQRTLNGGLTESLYEYKYQYEGKTGRHGRDARRDLVPERGSLLKERAPTVRRGRIEMTTGRAHV